MNKLLIIAITALCVLSVFSMDPQVCMLDKEIGHCKALANRFFFNTVTKKCEPFGYGGCGGNQNNFFTLQDCQDVCGIFEK